MTNQSTAGHRWAAVFPVATVTLLLTAQALMPSGLDQPIRSLATARSELSAAASQAGRLSLCTTLFSVGLGCLGASFPAIGTLCARTRGAPLATVASWVAALACLSGVVVNSLINLNVAGAVRANASQDAAAQVLLADNTALTPTAALVVYIGGLVLASVLLGAALWRARSIPRWLSALFSPSLILAAASPPGPAGVLLAVPFAVVMIMLAVRVAAGQPAVHDDGVHNHVVPSPA